MVASVQGPTPFSVQLKAREFKLSGSNQVVFLIEGCRKVRGPDGGPAIREGMGKLPNKAGQRPGMERRPGVVNGPRLSDSVRPGMGNPSNNCGSAHRLRRPLVQ